MHEEADQTVLYVASRASVPERPAMWQSLRDDHGWRINSSWIDEAGEGETADLGELWSRIEGEIRASDGMILYAETSDFPLKGALVEAGIAIGMGKPVAVVLSDPTALDPRSFRPLGSWAKHPLCRLCDSLESARTWIKTNRAVRRKLEENPGWHVEKASYGWNVLDADGREIAAGDGTGAFWLKEHADLAATSPELLAYAECEDALHRYSLDRGGITGVELWTVLRRHGYPAEDLTGGSVMFVRQLREKALARAGRQTP